ncbi:PREDICTED: uncharacterized protein LOC104757050 [Camelina sativa]|uniref:Uncharacterized protein LOC104757050 n=1 Tax=Camelina sativa TaxID=90675 RepID=A0ABM0WYN4_CAMSA|nr:PREDICTED: uncharacterized protein LOC104757050 [Camelina sativa]
MMRRGERDQQHQSRVFYDLSSLVLNLLRSPPMPISFPDDQFSDPPPRRIRPRPPHTSLHHRFSSSSPSLAHISPSGFASLLLGISVALMLCGSVTFFIGFLLLPWVLALIMVFYVAGIVSAISMVGRSILCYVLTPPSPSGKEISDWKLL